MKSAPLVLLADKPPVSVTVTLTRALVEFNPGGTVQGYVLLVPARFPTIVVLNVAPLSVDRAMSNLLMVSSPSGSLAVHAMSNSCPTSRVSPPTGAVIATVGGWFVLVGGGGGAGTLPATMYTIPAWLLAGVDVTAANGAAPSKSPTLVPVMSPAARAHPRPL